MSASSGVNKLTVMKFHKEVISKLSQCIQITLFYSNEFSMRLFKREQQVWKILTVINLLCMTEV